MTAVLDLEHAADECAAWAARAPLTEGVLTPFGVLDPAALSQSGKIDALMGLERTIAWAQAQQTRIMAEAVAHPDPVPAPTRAGDDYALLSLAGEIACALRWPAGTAMSRLLQAHRLVEQLPATVALLETGQISLRHAGVVSDAVRDLDPAIAAAVEARVLTRAPLQTASELRRSVGKAVADLDQDGDQERCAAAAERRRVACEPDADAMAWINAYLPAADAQTVMIAVQSVADRARQANPDDPRSADQRRADALTSICTGVLTGTMPDGVATWQGRKPAVTITVALSTLLACDDRPGDLDGYGPIPADLTRRIAADASGTWRRLITDPRGHALDYGRSVYRPPADLREFVIARDHTCRGIGCHQSARRADIDHIIPWAHGGRTDADNLGPQCSRDHHLKDDAGWSVTRDADGTVRWTSPTGRTYDKPPHEHPVDTTCGRPRPEPDPPPF